MCSSKDPIQYSAINYINIDSITNALITKADIYKSKCISVKV